MRNARGVALALAAGTLAGAGCPEEDPAPPIAPSNVEVTLVDFEANHPFFAYYALWVRFEAPTGRGLVAAPLGLFKADAFGDILIMGGGPLEIADDAPGVPRHEDGSPDWGRAVDALITVEPEIDPDPGPNLPAMVAGPITGSFTVLVTGDPAAIGVSLESASGSFVLATPTTPESTDADQGVWFSTPDGSTAGLNLPVLAPGWRYQGWVNVPTVGDFSLGAFAGPVGIDSDGPGPVPGGSPGFPFPGSDFPTGQPGHVLHTTNVSVTLEPPRGADGGKPFFLRVLQRSILDQAPGVSVTMTSEVSHLPTAELRIAISE